MTIAFRAPSTTGAELSSDDFAGRVPVALCFCDQPSEAAWPIVTGFDDRLEEFGHRRVQALLVMPIDPEPLRSQAQALGLSVPLLSDPGRALQQRLGAGPDDEGRMATVILDSQREPLDTIRQLPRPDHALAVLRRLDELRDQYGDRMAVLPDHATSRRAQREDLVEQRTGNGVPDSTDQVDPARVVAETTSPAGAMSDAGASADRAGTRDAATTHGTTHETPAPGGA